MWTSRSWLCLGAKNPDDYRSVFKTFEQVEVLQFEQVLLGQPLTGRAVHAGPSDHRVPAVTWGGRCVVPASPLPLVEPACALGDGPTCGQFRLLQPQQTRFLPTATRTIARLRVTSCSVADIWCNLQVDCSSTDNRRGRCTNRIWERQWEYWLSIAADDWWDTEPSEARTHTKLYRYSAETKRESTCNSARLDCSRFLRRNYLDLFHHLKIASDSEHIKYKWT